MDVMGWEDVAQWLVGRRRADTREEWEQVRSLGVFMPRTFGLVCAGR